MDVLPPKSLNALKKEATVSRKGRSQPANLRDCVSNMQNWPTITVNTSKNTSDGIDWKKRLKQGHLDGIIKAIEGSSLLNPDWTEWLMGWIIGWTSLEPIKEMLWLDWSVDPADEKRGSKTSPIPRVTTRIKNRANRLQAIGNGQVPQCMAKAFIFLSSHVIIE
jgi:hypothetical protein